MTQVDKGSLVWLMDSTCRRKALIRYEIKRSEARLHLLMINESTKKTHQVIEYCHNLIRAYEELQVINGIEKKQTDNLYPIEKDTHNCYQRLNFLQQQFCWQRTGFLATNIIEELIFYYKNLLAIFSNEEPHIVFASQSKVDSHLLAILEAKTTEQWLASIINFACNLGEDVIKHQAEILRLSNQDCLHLYQQFIEPDYLTLLQSIFLLKYQSITIDTFQAEEIDKSSKLNLLYQFIEFLHKTIIRQLTKKGFNPLYDSLFPENIPDDFSVSKQHRSLINCLIQKWTLPGLTMPETDLAHKKLTELLKAYKYWFNPTALIDTVMTMQCMFNNKHLTFIQHMRSLYQQLTTTECLELYGYFSNKASCYLMRTLYTAGQGLPIKGINPLNHEDRGSINSVYQALNDLMEPLLDELKSRHLKVPDYNYLNADKSLKPGKRILSAIERILTIYKIENKSKNIVMEQLFAVLEN